MSILATLTLAFVFTPESTGNSNPASTAIMAMTTSSSIRVKPPGRQAGRGETEFFIIQLLLSAREYSCHKGRQRTQRGGEFETTKYTKYTKWEQAVSDSFFVCFVL